MGPAVYFLGVIITLACSVLLLRGYLRVRQKLLFWSALCFFVLALSNVLVVIDLVIYPHEVNLYRWRLLSAAIAMMLLVYGLIWEGE
jgi:hypothetical protein